MIVFQNDGLIEMDAVRTMGVNVKERPGAFGHFGTGLKFAIATVLRGGGSVVIHRGSDERHEFRVTERIIRGQPFGIVEMSSPGGTSGKRKNWESLGFTDQLGKNWEPWMVLREFGCNALDEGGSMFSVELPDDNAREHMQHEFIGQLAEETAILVEWPELDAVFENERQSIFCTVDGYSQVLATEQVQVLEGQSDYLFYRGIRAYKLQHPSVMTYNILSPQTLTEDRTIAAIYYPIGEIRRLWLECTDKEALRRVLVIDGERFEDSINYMQTDRDPTREFLDVILDARMEKESKSHINKSAIDLLHRHLRSAESTGIGYTTSRFMNDEFSAAMEAIGEIFSEDQLRLDDSLPLVLVDDEQITIEGSLVMLEEGRIYVGRSLLRQGRRDIVAALLPLILQVRLGELVYMREITPVLVPVLMDSHPDLRHHDPRVAALDARPQEEQTMSVADSLLVAMDVRGEEYPVRPSELED